MASLVLFETPHFKLHYSDLENGVLLKLTGQIDEDVNFGAILGEVHEMASMGAPEGGLPRVFFDLQKVERINSCGVREWLLFLEKLQLKFKVEFRVASEAFIEQANIVPGILGPNGTPVHQIEIPYFCASCDERTRQLVPVASVKRTDGFTAPESKCAKCGSAQELDALEEEYFSFLKRH